MSAIRYKDKVYGGSAIVDNATHLIADNGSGTNVTGQQLFNNILGDFATVEASTTASKPYKVGEYLIYNSFLYKVTTAIASGGTINTGSGGNVVQTTVVDGIAQEKSNILGDFAEEETDAVATKNYSVGDYLVLNGYFYRVTDTITAGDTLVEGDNGNIERTNVGAELSTNISVPTFTPSSNAVSVPTNTLRIVDGVLCGNLQITTTNNMPTTQWTTVGTLSPAPKTMIQVSAFNPGNVSYFGVMAISTAGTVTLKPVVEAKSAMVMLSYYMDA